MEKELLLEPRVHGDSMFPFRLYMVDYLDGQVIFNVHWHPELEFIYVEKGPIDLQIGTKHLTLAEGTACFIPSGQLHGAYPSGDAPFRLHAMVFHINLLRSFGYDWIESNYIEVINHFSSFHPILLLPDSNDGKEILKNLETIIDAYEDRSPSFEMKIKGHLFLLFAEMLKKQVRNNFEQITQKDLTKTVLLKTVLQYIDSNYKERITVEDLASQIQMSEGHFSRFFKAAVRMTPMEYINSIRINKACTLLKKTDRQILDIAMDVGFNNQSYFIRLFKKQRGCTPKEYKRESIQ